MKGKPVCLDTPPHGLQFLSLRVLDLMNTSVEGGLGEAQRLAADAGLEGVQRGRGVKSSPLSLFAPD